MARSELARSPFSRPIKTGSWNWSGSLWSSFPGDSPSCLVILFRFKRPHVERPVRTLGYPVTPLIFIVITFLFVLNTLIERPIQAGAALALLGIGLGVYAF